MRLGQCPSIWIFFFLKASLTVNHKEIKIENRSIAKLQVYKRQKCKICRYPNLKLLLEFKDISIS